MSLLGSILVGGVRLSTDIIFSVYATGLGV